MHLRRQTSKKYDRNNYSCLQLSISTAEYTQSVMSLFFLYLLCACPNWPGSGPIVELFLVYYKVIIQLIYTNDHDFHMRQIIKHLYIFSRFYTSAASLVNHI